MQFDIICMFQTTVSIIFCLDLEKVIQLKPIGCIFLSLIGNASENFGTMLTHIIALELNFFVYFQLIITLFQTYSWVGFKIICLN